MQNQLVVDEKVRVCVEVVEYFNSYVEKFNHRHDCTLNDIRGFAGCFHYYERFYSEISDRAGVLKPPEHTLLRMAMKYISMYVLEKRISGMKFLSRYLSQWMEIEDEEKKKSIAEDIMSVGIVDSMYNTSYHSELSKNSRDLMEFVVPYLDKKALETILKDSFNTDLSKSQSICSLLNNPIVSRNPTVSTLGLTQDLRRDLRHPKISGGPEQAIGRASVSLDEASLFVQRGG